MDDFLGGFMGVGIGLALFLPSYLFTRQVIEGGTLSSVPLTFKVPMFLGMAVMLFSPIIFWGLMPVKDRLLSENNFGGSTGKNEG